MTDVVLTFCRTIKSTLIFAFCAEASDPTSTQLLCFWRSWGGVLTGTPHSLATVAGRNSDNSWSTGDL